MVSSGLPPVLPPFLALMVKGFEYWKMSVPSSLMTRP